MMNIIKKTIDLGNGREVTIETGKLAKQADGSVVVKQGDTMLLATVVSAQTGSTDVDFLPMSVDYRENFAAAGRYPGGFKKREAKSSDAEVIVSRLIDRVLRPLFPSDYHASTIVSIELISADREGEVMPDALAALAASSALMVSDIPFAGPISEVRVARINGEFLINPTLSQLKEADIDIMLGGTEEDISMVEGEANEISEDELIQAMQFGHKEVIKHCKIQKELEQEAGKTEKREYSHETHSEELKADLKEAVADKVYDIVKKGTAKQERAEAFGELKDNFLAQFVDDEDAKEKERLTHIYFKEIEKGIVRKVLLDDKLRLDGRAPEEIRDIWSEIDYLPGTHGSAVFTRGETQALASVTLGSPLDEQTIDNVMVQGSDKFILHYNFPPFSTGDARPKRFTSRREIGHGHLAHRALKKMLPEDNPYTIRIVSDILESNGSSSMASVCGGTLALMDAGIKINKPVSGIAMGLITEGDRFTVLSDILGDEDFLGDMDFKVTGTKDGITACQMDIKVDGLSYEILNKALEQSKEGRLHILGKMMETMSEPREDYKDHVPGMVSLTVNTDKIGTIIGPGGKTIQKIQKETETTISIDEEDGVGKVVITGPNQQSIEEALNTVKGLVEEPEVNKVYKATIKSVVNFGAFCEILPGKEGLLHISEIANERIEKVEDVLKEGDEIEVKLLQIDKRSGKMKLSRKVLLDK
ncbi:MAG: polyribonucleotide nucleotidyltransferase [Bacteroidota bacterium]|nr:polyribonucleotide nucleotidyltransferase [Bacteroidota bacterium]